MKRLLRAIALAAVVALGVSGCGYKAQAGKVIEMEYNAAWNQWIPGSTTCTYNSSTKSSSCTTRPGYYVYHPECYKIRVEDEKEHRGSWCVSSETYNNTQINDYFDAKAQNN